MYYSYIIVVYLLQKKWSNYEKLNNCINHACEALYLQLELNLDNTCMLKILCFHYVPTSQTGYNDSVYGQIKILILELIKLSSAVDLLFYLDLSTGRSTLSFFRKVKKKQKTEM